MYTEGSSLENILGQYQMASVSMRYSLFVPRLYNFAKSLGFSSGKMMPSRAFCSDESQGYPIILIAKHFGTFPFNHGRVGGIVATDRHAPHAHHGQDLIIIQASHVGYEPVDQSFGHYRRLQTNDAVHTTSCGKICGTLDWYLNEYHFASEHIFLSKSRHQDKPQIKITIDNKLLDLNREEGLFLHLDKFIKMNEQGKLLPESANSTSKTFIGSAQLFKWIDSDKINTQAEAIADKLHPDLFTFKRNISSTLEGKDHLEKNLIKLMPHIVTSKWPALTAAQANTQIEFDRTYRTILNEPSYQNKKVLFISGLNVDISPQPGQIFPLTKFIPWAAYTQDETGNYKILEQAEIFEQLEQQLTENPDQIDLESAIEIMENVKELHLPF